MIAGLQTGLNDSAGDIRDHLSRDVEKIGIPMFFFPKIGRVLPAAATIAYIFLDVNRGRLDDEGFPVILTFNDIYNILVEIGLGSIVNKSTLRAGFYNIVNKKRDDVTRQMLTSLFKDVRSEKISFLKERGRPQKGYYFGK